MKRVTVPELELSFGQLRMPFALMIYLGSMDGHFVFPFGSLLWSRYDEDGGRRPWTKYFGFGGSDRCAVGVRVSNPKALGICINVNWTRVWQKGLRAQTSIGIGYGFGMIKLDLGNNVNCVPQWRSHRRKTVMVERRSTLYEDLVESVGRDGIAALVNYENPLRMVTKAVVDRKAQRKVYKTRLGAVLKEIVLEVQ